MNPLVHLEVGSFFANARDYDLRQRRLIMLAALAPDLDGVFMPLDWVHRIIPPAESIYIFSGGFGERLHHLVSHNVFYCVAVSAALAVAGRSRRLEVFCLCLAAALTQIGLDVLTNDSSWSQQFLRPLSSRDFQLESFIPMADPYLVKVVIIQYALIVLIQAGVVALYLKKGRTFLELVHPRLDALLVNFIRLPFVARCAVCGDRALYQATEGGATLCSRHVAIDRRLWIRKKDQSKGDAPK